MKDLKYIIKRVIIGVAIVLVLAYIRTGKALALEDYSSYQGAITRTTINSSSVLQLIYTNNLSGAAKKDIYQDRTTGDIVFCVNANDTGCRIFYVSQLPNFTYDKIGAVIDSKVSSSTPYNFLILSNESVLPKFSTVDPIKIPADYKYLFIKIHGVNDCSLYYVNNEVFNYNINLTSSTRSYNSNVAWNYYSSSNANVNIENYYTSTPEFVSWNFYRNIQDGVVVSAGVSPEFSNFDTTNYIYQWKFGHNGSWNNLEENEQLLNFKTNGPIYVRILDNNNNNIIDPMPTIYINVIGKVATDYDYDIKFSHTYSTSRTSNATLGITVEEVKTDIEFIPENSMLRYQYKFVPTDEDPTNVVWTTSATTNISYNTTVNGTIYARITDTDYNMLYQETRTITNIGQLAIGVGDTNDKDNNFWTQISSKINYGGPVSSLFLIPVSFLTTLYSSMYNSNSCSPYSLNSLLGVSLQLDCINFRSIVGNSFYNMIDLLICFVLCIGIFKFILKLYDSLISMKEGVD